MSICPCPGLLAVEEVNNRIAIAKSGVYISPEEKRYFEFFNEKFECQFPNCPCPSKEISGKLLDDRIDFIINSAKSDKNFSRKDLKFTY